MGSKATRQELENARVHVNGIYAAALRASSLIAVRLLAEIVLERFPQARWLEVDEPFPMPQAVYDGANALVCDLHTAKADGLDEDAREQLSYDLWDLLCDVEIPKIPDDAHSAWWVPGSRDEHPRVDLHAARDIDLDTIMSGIRRMTLAM